jgi:hypothetical protein
VIRSTRSDRSSIRAWRSARTSVSSRSSRRIIWFESPLTSASRREIGAASSRRPSRSALPTGVRQHDLELVGRLCEGLHLAAGPARAPRRRPAAASSGRPSLRTVTSPSDEYKRARLRAPAGADRPAAGRQSGRIAAPRRLRGGGEPRHRRFRGLPGELPPGRSSSSTTRASCPPDPDRGAARGGASPRAARWRGVGGARQADAAAAAGAPLRRRGADRAPRRGSVAPAAAR